MAPGLLCWVVNTATCPDGRQPGIHGYPLNITELASHLTGTCYVTDRAWKL